MADKKLYYVQMPICTGLNQSVFVAWNHLVACSSSVEKQRDDFYMSFARSHNERISVSSYRQIRIPPAIQQQSGGFEMTAASCSDEWTAVTCQDCVYIGSRVA